MHKTLSNSTLSLRLIKAGRRLKQAHDAMDAGERAALRRDGAELTAGFWRCVEQARIAGMLTAEELHHSEDVIRLMMPLCAMRHLNGGSENGKDVGTSLRHCDIAQRRIDALLGERDLEGVVEQLESVFTIAKAPVDFGVLLRDLIRFKWDPLGTRRAWAKSYFSGIATLI